MADPLSVAASVAGIVSLADVLWRTSRDLYGFFSAVKDASKNVQSMLLELQQFEGILTSIKNNTFSFNGSQFVTNDGLSGSGLLTNLKYCSAEFKVLKDIVEDSRRNQGQGPVKKLASQVKWVFDEKKIAQCCQRLEKVKLLLNTVLSLAGREDNKESLLCKLKSTQDVIQAAQTVSGTQHQSLIHRVQQSTSETHEKLSAGFTSLNGMSQDIQSDTTTLKRKFEEAYEETKSRTEFICKDLSLAISSILRVDQMMRTGVKQNAKRQRRLEQQQADNTIRFLEGMDRIQAMLSNHIRGAPPAGTVHPERMSNTADNLDRIVMPLMLMNQSLCEVLGMMESGGEIFLSEEEVQLLQSEINEILAAGHEASAAALRRRQFSNEDGCSASLGQLANTDSPEVPRSYELCSQPLHTQGRGRKTPWKNFTRRTFAGTLSICVQREPGSSSTDSSASITFMPQRELYKLGVSVVLTNELRAVANPKISRYIRTFNVLPYYVDNGETHHPAIQAIYEDNVLELQRLLSAKEVSPWDRTFRGDDLISIAATRGSYEVAQLLFQEIAPTCEFWFETLKAIYRRVSDVIETCSNYGDLCSEKEEAENWELKNASKGKRPALDEDKELGGHKQLEGDEEPEDDGGAEVDKDSEGDDSERLRDSENEEGWENDEEAEVDEDSEGYDSKDEENSEDEEDSVDYNDRKYDYGMEESKQSDQDSEAISET
ncbi:hypothetical protein MMC30_003865 [Trapelia coarctata]|nr:hypothetical protein [Trapelia coarctata]